ncbi:MAG: sulfatase [Planctomycetes bacterium]|nr:sulfatase [Planctomycetota bacterium]
MVASTLAGGVRSALHFAAGMLAGLGLTGILHGTAQLVAPEPGWLRESVALAAGGNLIVGAALLPAVVLISLVLRPARGWTVGRGLLFGIAMGLLPVIGTLAIRLQLYRGHATVAMYLAPLLFFAVRMWPSRYLPRAAISHAILVISVVAWWWAGGRGLEPSFPVDSIEGDTALRESFSRTGGPVVGEAAPDVVLFSLDTMRADAVHGNHRATVPHLDGLAARGLSAPYARSGSNCTLPGHIEMFTGMGPLAHGILNNSGVTPNELPILGELFAEAGWNTVAVISNRVIERRFGPSRGFEIWHDALGTAHNHLARLGENTLLGWISDRDLFSALHPVVFFGQHEAQAEWGAREAERTAQTAIARIHELKGGSRPFLLVVHFMDAHDPYYAPEHYRGKRSAVPGDRFSEHDETRARYWEEVDYLDAQLGRVFEAIEQTGRPTVICVTGDHGEHLGEQGMVGHSDELYEAVVRVPFFLAGPGVPAGELPPVSLIDVAPTLLTLAGLSVPMSMEGRDVRTQLGKGLDQERFLFARDERSVSAVVGAFKWAADWPRGAEVPLEGGWRDLVEDSGETGPLLQEAPPGVLEEIKRRLGAAMLRMGAAMSFERRAALAELGYVDSASE